MESSDSYTPFPDKNSINGERPDLHAALYPSQEPMKIMFKSPLLLWRMGLDPLLGRLFMIITSTGRKSALPRRTVVEYRDWDGRIYAFAAWPKSDWYQNIMADPYVTIQTSAGSRSAKARRVTAEEELNQLYPKVKDDPIIKGIAQMLGFDLTREAFLRERDKFHLLAFDPTTEPTPLPQARDLMWVLPAALLLLLLGLLLGRRSS